MSSKALLDHFSALDAPRRSGKVIYPLPKIMLVVSCATLAAAEDFVEVRRWSEEKLDFLLTMLTGTSKVTLEVPRDRAGTFDPRLIAEYQRRFLDFDDSAPDQE